MRKIKRNHTIIIVLCALLTISLVSHRALAAIEVSPSELSTTVNYDALRDNKDKISVSFPTITLTNTGNATETITFSFTELPSNHDLSLSQTSVSLNAGSSTSVSISGTIPVNPDQGKHSIGKLKITSSTGDALYPLQTDVLSMLKLREVRVIVNGVEKKTFNDDTSMSNLKPGDALELHFRLENLFDDNYDNGDIDGTISVDIEDSDFEGDVNEQEDFSLGAGKRITSENEEMVISFTIPALAKEGDYKAAIKIEGEDQNNANYEQNLELTLKVERQQDDLRVQTLTVSPAELSCFRKAELVAKVSNQGKNRQKNSVLTIINSDLNINIKENFDLPAGTSEHSMVNKLYSLDLPKDLKADSYPIVGTVFYDFNQFADRQTATLVIKPCTTAPSAPTTPQETSKEEPTAATTAASAPIKTEKVVAATAHDNASSTVVKTMELPPYTAEDYLIAAVIVAIIFILALIIIFFMILMK